MPAVKELHYFNIIEEGIPTSLRARIFDKRNWRWRHFIKVFIKRNFIKRKFKHTLARLRCLLGEMNDEWYSSRFRPKKNQIVGEGTPEYAGLNKETIMRVKSLMPDLKIIYLLRNPIDRAWSSVFTMFNVWEKPLDLSEDEIKLYLKGSFQKSQGNYVKNLDNWMGVFPKERFCINFNEEISLDPDNLLINIFRFLGVSDDPKHIREHLSHKVILPGWDKPIPDDIRKFLTEMYLDDLKNLSERFGSHATNWYESAQEYLGLLPPVYSKNIPSPRDEVGVSR